MIYLQSNNDGTRPHHFDVACAMWGAIDNEMPYKLISFDDLMSGKFDNLIKSNLFVGSVEFLREVFKKVNKNPRVPLNSNREEEIIKLSEAKSRILSGEELFIKPKEIKLFTGMVTNKDFISCLEPYNDDELVIISKPFNSEILTEWRAYIHMNRIFDIRNYSGDPFVLPNENYILSLIDKYKGDFPTAYTIDVGVLESGENVVIEFNDMWAIGNYGMDNSTYLRLLKQRYFEIIKSV